MAQSSAQKRARQSEKRRVKNKSEKSKIKTYIKKYNVAVKSENIEEVEKSMRDGISLIYSAARKNLIHKNQAARRASRMAKKLNMLKAQKQS